MPFTPPSVDPNLYPDWQAWARQLLKYLQQTSDEQAASIGYQLAGHASTNLPSAAQDGTIIYKTDSQYVSAAFASGWYDLAMTNRANTFTAQQDVNTGATSFQAGIQIYSTDPSADSGPYLIIDRRSPSPAINDAHGGLLFRGRNAVDETTDFVFVFAAALQVTDGAEYGQLVFNTIDNGAQQNQFSVGNGVRVGVPTSGFLGRGKLNVQGEYHVNGVQVVKGRITGWAAASGTPTRTTFDTATVTLPQLAERVKALIDDAISHGLIGT